MLYLTQAPAIGTTHRYVGSLLQQLGEILDASGHTRFFVGSIAYLGEQPSQGDPHMNGNTGGERPPQSTDLAAWRQAVADGRLRQIPFEAIVAAIQDLGPDTDKAVQNALVKHLSDFIYTHLKRKIGRNYLNNGKDIIDRVHFQVFEAIATPRSADGKGTREAFYSRVMFRLKDAIAQEALERRIPDESTAKRTSKPNKIDRTANENGEEVTFTEIKGHPDQVDDVELPRRVDAVPSSVLRDPTLLDGARYLEQQIDVNRFLEENILDDRKRLAFYLFMDGLPYKSKKFDSIAKALGIDEKTARQWIEEIQQDLKAKVGDRP